MGVVMRGALLVLIMLGGLTAYAAAQHTETGFLDRTLEDRGTARHYQVFVPRAYDATVAWPVVLLLRGGSEQGTDGVRPTSIGMGDAIRGNPDRFPAIVVFPQVRAEHQWT